MNAIMMLHRAMAGYLAAQGGGGGSKYIEFADPEVFRVLMENGVSSDGVGITTADVEKVTSIGTWFNQNTEIEYFNEFEKFTGVTTLGYNNTYTAPFYKCTALKQIKLPNSITKINTASFSGCTSLELLPDVSNVSYLGSSAFSGCTSMVGVVNMPNVTNDISGGEFALTKISKVQSLGQIKRLSYGSNNTTSGTFTQCPSLESVVLPETLTSIGQYCFYNCAKLSNVVFRQSLQTISNNAFQGCTSLEIPDLSLPNLTSLGRDAFYGVKIKKISDLGKITALPTASSSTQNFGDKSVLEEVVLPDDLTTIGDYCFYNYTKLTKCYIPSSVTTISLAAFYNASSLSQDVVLPNLVTMEKGNTFRNTAITSFIATSLSGAIRDQSFYDCKSLAKVEIGAVESIGTQVFQASSLLDTVIINADTPPTLANANSFANTPIASGTGYIYVPDASVDAYKAATNWAQFSDVIKPISEYTE